MAIHNLNQFLQHYFTTHDCQIVHDQEGVLTVQLTEAMDRALMNRPFYWHYIKKIGRIGEPKQLTLITNPDKRDEKGEWIHYGSPRLHQIFSHLENNEKYTRLFQRIDTTVKTALYPWLVVNVKLSYIGKQKKDEIISIGLHLINGTIKHEMMEQLQAVPLQMTISDYCFTLSPIITLRSGFIRIEAKIDEHVQSKPCEWADESVKTLREEVDLLKHFYVDTDDELLIKQMEQEIREITDRYQPNITYKVINGGIFYLAEGALV